MADRVVLHVGSPKSGTTYLQNRLRANTAALRRHHVVVPGRRRGDWFGLPFLAGLDLLEGQDVGLRPQRVQGRWSILVRHVRRAPGTVVISHEVFARADAATARRALADLVADAEVDIVLTARDLGRGLPAAWQETLKHGGTLTFADYLHRARSGRAQMVRSMDPVRVLSAWGADLPAERVHVVTAPPAGSDPEELWRRFAAALGLDPSWAPSLPTRANPSPGVVGAQLLRALNAELAAEVGRLGRLQPVVWDVVRDLGNEPEPVPVRLGPGDHAWVSELAESWTAWLGERGYVVHGALDDLRPAALDPATWVDPDLPRPEVSPSAVDDLVASVRANVAARHRSWRLRVKRMSRRLRLR